MYKKKVDQYIFCLWDKSLLKHLVYFCYIVSYIVQIYQP